MRIIDMEIIFGELREEPEGYEYINILWNNEKIGYFYQDYQDEGWVVFFTDKRMDYNNNDLQIIMNKLSELNGNIKSI